MVRILVARRMGGLYPVDDAAKEVIQKLGHGEIMAVEIKRPRHLAHHRRFFAMLQIVFQNQGFYKSLDDLLDVCKLSIGHYRTVRTREGDVKIPMSISFAALDQDSFEDFYSRACDWVVQDVIPGLARHDLDEEVRIHLEEIAGARVEGARTG